jgi:DNA helicase-2/ATP-dependent DNA helicase PcrA
MSYKQTCLLNSDIWSNKFKVSNNKHVDGELNNKLRSLINVKQWSYGTNTNKFLSVLNDKELCEYQYSLFKKYFKEPEKHLTLDCDRLVITFECQPKDVEKLLGTKEYKHKGIRKFSSDALGSILTCRTVPVGNINYGNKGETRPYYNHAFNLRINNSKSKSMKLYVADGFNETLDGTDRISSKTKNKIPEVSTPLSFRLDFIPNKFSDFEISVLFNHLKSKLTTSRYQNFINTAKVTRVDVAFNMHGVLSPFVWCLHEHNYIEHNSSYPVEEKVTETVYIGHRSKSSHFIIYDKLLKEFKGDRANFLSQENIKSRFQESSVVTRIEHRYYPNRSYNSKHENKRNNRRTAVLKLSDLSTARIALHSLKFISPRILLSLKDSLLKKVIRKREYSHIKAKLPLIKKQFKESSGKKKLQYFSLNEECMNQKKEQLLKHYQLLIDKPLKTPDADIVAYTHEVLNNPEEKVELSNTDYASNIQQATASQKKAAKAKEPLVMVIAGAGSGKTKTIVDRVKSLTRGGGDPRKIRVLAYTNDVSKELNNRINPKIKHVNIGDHFSQFDVPVSTFSSWCKEILDKYLGEKYKGYRLLIPEGAKLKLRGIAKDVGFSSYKEQCKVIDILETSINRCCSLKKTIERYYSLENINLTKVRKVRELFKEYKKQENLYDYNDFIKLSVEEVKSNNAIAKSVSRAFKHIIVDEMQDSNKLQWKLLTLLTKEGTNLFCVGDPAQSIYGFRGASYREIERFKLKFDNAEIYRLAGNFRTTESILELTNFVRTRLGYKELKCCTTGGNLPQLVESTRFDQLLVWLRRTLIERRAKFPKESVQILIRTNKAVEQAISVIKEDERLSSDLQVKRIKIMTMHGSKGTESDACFVVDPRLTDNWLQKKEDTLRLLYVALTRAKKHLVICNSANGQSYYEDSKEDIFLLDLVAKQENLFEFIKI